MIGPRHIAVIDIGKTNAKLALADLDSLSEIAVETRSNRVRPGPPYPHFDLEGHWRFILDGLARLHATHRIDAVTATTHGASCVLLDAQGALAAPMLDYEHPGPDELAAEYDAIRPPFAETGSPRLPIGLNVGAQLFWQLRRDPGLAGRLASFVGYPQYWGFRLTGIRSLDVTSIGCHTDLWNPQTRTFSGLVDRLGLGDRMAPIRKSSDILGPILPAVAEATGLAPDTPVACGIHDSNASLYPHLLAQTAPFSVVSTGTWVVAMAVGGRATPLDPARDTLINVNAFGEPVPSAKFMGGREYEIICGKGPPAPTGIDIDGVLSQGLTLLPAVETGSGPFPGRQARWSGGEPPAGSGARSAAAAFYLAMMAAECLTMIGHAGPVIVEGPFARNALFLSMLAVATGSRVLSARSATGTAIGAALLFQQGDPPDLALTPAVVSDQRRLKAYAHAWRDAIARR